MRAGSLPHRVTHQRLTETADTFGEMIQTWGNLGTYWAGIRGLSAREAEIAGQLQTRATHTITMRDVRASITPKDRLTFEGRVFGVEHVQNIEEAGKELRIMVTEDI
jgi:SPP1 family predicted phage head-tail adaptor